jgi:hypothetical protein
MVWKQTGHLGGLVTVVIGDGDHEREYPTMTALISVERFGPNHRRHC